MKNIVLFLFFLFSFDAAAQVDIAKGQPAPADGVFLTNLEAAKIIAEKKAADKICQIEKDFAVDTEVYQCSLDKQLLKNEIKYEKTKYDQIVKIRDKNEEDLYRKIGDGGNNLYWFAGGIAVGATTVVTSIATVYLIMSSK